MASRISSSQSTSSDLTILLDPFEIHFAQPDEDLLSRSIKAVHLDRWRTKLVRHGQLGKAIISNPVDGADVRSNVPKEIPGPERLKVGLSAWN